MVTLAESTSGRHAQPDHRTVPTSTFTTSIVVRASQNAATGPHPVTLAGTSIDTSDGSGSGNSATEDFQVEKLAVDISGPPYVIIDNAPATSILGIHFPPPHVDSTYTEYATGGSGNYKWNWSVSSNIAFESVTGRFKTSHQRAQFRGSKPATDFLSYNVQ